MRLLLIKLLAGETFMPEMHLRQPGFTHSTCGPILKNKGRIQKFKETGDSRYISQNEFDKACFYRFIDLPRRALSDKVLHDEAFNIAKKCVCVYIYMYIYVCIYIYIYIY